MINILRKKGLGIGVALVMKHVIGNFSKESKARLYIVIIFTVEHNLGGRAYKT